MGLALNLALEIGASSPVPYDPSQITSLIAWYRSDLVVQAAGTCSKMTDKSASGIHAVQTGGSGSEPNYSASDAAFGGKPSLASTAFKWLQTASNLTYGACTILFVGSCTSASASYLYVHGSDSGSNAEYLYSNIGASMNLARGGVVSAYDVSTNWAINATPRTIALRFDGTHAGHTLRINGVAQSLTNYVGGAPGVATAAGIFGLYAAPTGQLNSTGKYAEWIICNAALSDTDVAKAEAYLRARYGHY